MQTGCDLDRQLFDVIWDENSIVIWRLVTYYFVTYSNTIYACK